MLIPCVGEVERHQLFYESGQDNGGEFAAFGAVVGGKDQAAGARPPLSSAMVIPSSQASSSTAGTSRSRRSLRSVASCDRFRTSLRAPMNLAALSAGSSRSGASSTLSRDRARDRGLSSALARPVSASSRCHFAASSRTVDGTRPPPLGRRTVPAEERAGGGWSWPGRGRTVAGPRTMQSDHPTARPVLRRPRSLSKGIIAAVSAASICWWRSVCPGYRTAMSSAGTPRCNQAGDYPRCLLGMCVEIAIDRADFDDARVGATPGRGGSHGRSPSAARPAATSALPLR